MFKYSQGWIKITAPAVRVLQTHVLASYEAPLPSVPQGFYSHLRTHLCLTLPQERKWRSVIASPEDYAPPTSMGLDAGAKVRTRPKKKRRENSEEKLQYLTTRRKEGARYFVYIRREYC